MPKREPQDWEDLERDWHAAAVSPEEIEAGARELLAQARGHQLAETRKQLGIGQKDIAAGRQRRNWPADTGATSWMSGALPQDGDRPGADSAAVLGRAPGPSASGPQRG